MATIKRLLMVVGSVMLMMLTCFVIAQLTEPGDRVFDFLFRRNFVQFVTLSVFFLAMILLVRRLAGYMRQRKGSVSLLARKVKEVRERLQKHGAAAASSTICRMVAEEEDRIRGEYEFINFAVCALPALGLFGTVLGLSDSLFQAFGRGSVGADSMGQFVVALGSALDTTVLAMICALPSFGAAWLLARFEERLCKNRFAKLRSQFDLHDVAQGQPGGSVSEAPVPADLLRTDLRALVSDVGQNAKSAFEQIIQSASESYRQRLDQALMTVLKQQVNHEPRMIRKLAEQFRESIFNGMDGLRKSIENQNGHSAELVIKQLKKLEKTLHRMTPDELTIRFDRSGLQGGEVR